MNEVDLLDKLCDELDNIGIEGNVIERNILNGNPYVVIWPGKFGSKATVRTEELFFVHICANRQYEVLPSAKYRDYFSKNLRFCKSKKPGYYIMSLPKLVNVIEYLFEIKEYDMNNIKNEATRELCHIIAYESDKSPLRWDDVRDDSASFGCDSRCDSIYICNNNIDKVCKVRIYENSLRCSKNNMYYVYFMDEYSSVAKELKDPRIAGITEAEGYKFVSPRHVVNFVREVVRLKERGGVLKDCKREVVDRMERSTKEILMKKYKNAPHFKVNSITYSTSDIEVNTIQRQYMTIEAEILPGAYFVTAPKVELINAIQSIGTSPSTDIKDVIFNDPATIIIWEDGSKTVVKAENEEFDPEKGLAMAISKRMLGNRYDYYDIFKKYVGRYEKKQKKGKK